MTKTKHIGWHTAFVVLSLSVAALAAVGYLRLGRVNGRERGRATTADLSAAATIPPPPPTRPGTGPLVQSSNLIYRGAFRVPSETFGCSSVAYGDTALAFNRARNSLCMVGHDWHQQVAEIAIPEIRLIAGKRGQQRPWEAKPYAVWSLPLPFANTRADIQGATYDPATNRISVSQAFGDDDAPVIHVLSILVV